MAAGRKVSELVKWDNSEAECGLRENSHPVTDQIWTKHVGMRTPRPHSAVESLGLPHITMAACKVLVTRQWPHWDALEKVYWLPQSDGTILQAESVTTANAVAPASLKIPAAPSTQSEALDPPTRERIGRACRAVTPDYPNKILAHHFVCRSHGNMSKLGIDPSWLVHVGFQSPHGYVSNSLLDSFKANSTRNQRGQVPARPGLRFAPAIFRPGRIRCDRLASR